MEFTFIATNTLGHRSGGMIRIYRNHYHERSELSMSFQKLLEELENEDLDIPAHIREARFGELRKQAAEFEGMRDREHGVYRCVHPGDIQK